MVNLIFYRRLAKVAMPAALLCLAAATADFTARHWLVVDHVRISGGDSTARAAAADLLNRMRGRGLLSFDLFALKRQLEDLPGVARAELARDLPDTLRAHLEIPKPLARWEGGGLVDVYGKRHKGVADASLPIFKGGEGYVQNMMELYDDARKILRGDVIAQLELSDGGDWRVFLQNKLVLYLGREEPRRRLALYARHARTLREKFPDMRAVDLRYERGFTVVNAPADTPNDDREKHT